MQADILLTLGAVALTGVANYLANSASAARSAAREKLPELQATVAALSVSTQSHGKSLDDLTQQMRSIRTEVGAEFSKLRTELRTEFNDLRTDFKELRTDFKETDNKIDIRSRELADKIEVQYGKIEKLFAKHRGDCAVPMLAKMNELQQRLDGKADKAVAATVRR